MKQTLLISLCLTFSVLSSCKAKKINSDVGAREGEDTELSEHCRMKHDPGPCRGAFTRYYYDRKTEKCASFIYGGCQGVVPFETLEDCQAACER